MLRSLILDTIVLIWIGRVCWRVVLGRNNVLRDMPDWVFWIWYPHIFVDTDQDELTRKLRWQFAQERARRPVPDYAIKHITAMEAA